MTETAGHPAELLRDLAFERRITLRTVLREATVAPAADIGLDYPESGMHTPDEDIRIADFHRGTRAMTAMLERFAEG